MFPTSYCSEMFYRRVPQLRSIGIHSVFTDCLVGCLWLGSNGSSSVAVLTIVSFIDILGVPYHSPFGEDTHIAFFGGLWYGTSLLDGPLFLFQLY